MLFRSIREEFVFGYIEGGRRILPTMQVLADRHGVAASYIRKAATKGMSAVPGGWVEDRAQAQMLIAESTKRSRAGKIGAAIADVEARHYRELLGVESAVMTDLFQTDKDGSLSNPPRFRSDLSAADKRALFGMLNDSMSTQRLILGQPQYRIDTGVNEPQNEPAFMQLASDEEIKAAARMMAIAITRDRHRARVALPEAVDADAG